ncbi:HepT-like ribonuclease domain-containing protein [Flavobacterium difficile]|uniref:DUF86 domain-containing protein n=1 Tax=Flavobacterium difficile TaxID=2709659 RepID=A0ABX0I3Z9_9FLAO|nr:DUF86 domain-containing protein [Flavobacterium difficile]NHM00509.1 DUF86 domain-containing protein [Flavobacterium difficile]
MDNKDVFRLEHILESINKIQYLVSKLNSLENFEKEWIEQDALIRNFEIIGQASNHVSNEIKEKHSEVSWKELKGMRNFITHEYFGLQLDTIWETAVYDLPILQSQIQKIIESLN